MRYSGRHVQELRAWALTHLPPVCAKCGGQLQPGDPWDLGHQVARRRGGTDQASNLRREHRGCNRAEGASLRGPTQGMRQW